MREKIGFRNILIVYIGTLIAWLLSVYFIYQSDDYDEMAPIWFSIVAIVVALLVTNKLFIYIGVVINAILSSIWYYGCYVEIQSYRHIEWTHYILPVFSAILNLLLIVEIIKWKNSELSFLQNDRKEYLNDLRKETSKNDLEDRLLQLKKLSDEKLITIGEYESIRKRLLGLEDIRQDNNPQNEDSVILTQDVVKQESNEKSNLSSLSEDKWGKLEKLYAVLLQESLNKLNEELALKGIINMKNGTVVMNLANESQTKTYMRFIAEFLLFSQYTFFEKMEHSFLIKYEDYSRLESIFSNNQNIIQNFEKPEIEILSNRLNEYKKVVEDEYEVGCVLWGRGVCKNSENELERIFDKARFFACDIIMLQLQAGHLMNLSEAQERIAIMRNEGKLNRDKNKILYWGDILYPFNIFIKSIDNAIDGLK